MKSIQCAALGFAALVCAAPALAMDPIEERISRDDLTAQEGMWRAADSMLTVSLFQLLVGAAGTIAVVYSIAQSRDAVALTRRALALQQKTTHHELRAYLSIVPKDPGLDDLGKGRLTMKIRNYGQTPAVNVHRWANRKWIDGLPDGLEMSFPETFRLRPWRDLAPSAEADIFDVVALSADRLAELAQRKKSLIEYGVVAYDDVFGQRHCETWCYIRYGARLETRKRNNLFQPDHEVIGTFLAGGQRYNWPDFSGTQREAPLLWLQRLFKTTRRE